MPEWSAEIRRRLEGLRIDPAREASVVEELSQHLEDRYAELVADGAAPEDARRSSLEELAGGGLAASLKASLPRPAPTRTPPPEADLGLLAGLAKDFRYGARRLRLEPAFALVAILSLALGIGANTAIFQLLDAVRLRSLPVSRPGELVNVRIGKLKGRTGSFSGHFPDLTSLLFERIRAEQKAFSQLAAWSSDRINLAAGGEARYAEALWVSGTFFDTVGVAPLRGRLLGPADDMPGCPSPSVVVSERFWRRELGGKDLAAGQTIALEGRRFEIAGITPARFFGVEVGHAFDVALPTCAEDLLGTDLPRTQGRSSWWLSTIGRLAPGWTLAKANAHLDAISKGVFEAALPEDYDAADSKNFLEMKLAASPAATGFSDLRSDYSNPLWLLLGISSLVLLIACANIANLMIARASARQREIAIRLALGASRRRLVRQLLAESLVLAAAGALAGAALAQVLSRKLLAFLGTHDTQWVVEMPLDLRLLAFTAGIAILTCVLFGLLPALQASRTDPIEAMKASGRGIAGGGARLAVRRALVVSQVALSLVLLVGALLFVRSLRNLLTLDAGFGRDHVLIVDVDHTRLRVPKERRVALRADVLERVRAVPGVTDAAVARLVPLGGRYWNSSISVEGTDVRHQAAYFNQAGPGYFRAIGSTLLAGRDFTAQDDVSAPPVAIVTEAFARKFLAGASPIGRTVQIDNQGGDTVRRFEIVGFARDSKYEDLREDFQPLVYLSQAQDRDPRPWFSVIVRSDLPLSGLRRALSSAVGSVSPEIDLQFQPMSDLLRDGLVRDRLMASLSAFFGFLAALLAMIGLYGVVSYMVERRRNEIGVRMALGATRGDILGLVLREAGTLLAAGLAHRNGLAIGAASFARSLLFGLKPSDPATLALAAAGLTAVAAVASLLPARRAATLDPVTALRDE